MTREERELARLLIADPVVRAAVRKLARALLGLTAVAALAMAVAVLAGGR